MRADSTNPLPKAIAAIRAALLAWYDAQARDLPWRILPGARKRGECPDPYRVWLSEIMLQQTSVAAVRGYYAAFLTRWPRLQELANAPIEEVLSVWAGLGYYARARNLHACANKVVDCHNGVFPQTEAGLRALPGIGDYTAAAMVAILHQEPTNVVDGNVERVMARLHVVEEPLPRVKTQLRSLAAQYVAARRAADWPQALMDLGATVCRPKNPDCDACPLNQFCAAAKTGNPAAYPRRARKAPRLVRHGVAFVLRRDDAVLLQRRPAQGLLGGMCEVPGSEWSEDKSQDAHLLCAAPVKAKWGAIGSVRHVFTHFTLELAVFEATAPKNFQTNFGWWAKWSALDQEALPSLMRKVLALVARPPT